VKRLFCAGTLFLGLSLFAAWVSANNPQEKSSCGHHGTSVDFFSTPSKAADDAKKEQKLVFVLHVSGHFEDPKFT
jgi:hypothetical protein